MSRMYPGETWAEAVETTHNDKELTKIRNRLWGQAPQLDEVEKAKRRFGDARQALEKALDGWVDYKAQPRDLCGLSKWKVRTGLMAHLGDGVFDLELHPEVTPEIIQNIFSRILEKSPNIKELWAKFQKARTKLEKVKEGGR